ncbi:HAD superfamily protein involved in N-acetyl-glucosamine catabolism [Paramagnetospirillum magnetotacticum MS-1]|uniref:HAD superfamily protein involved in N-acetyl-glucosamine catabolism n=1 Tax=Paramagnetospirillum magnetotacticum MS-1 TaxID=272627 RepID=A0A0C2YAQ4_PARME|nr:TIGR01459 family HAD-type hydrolase [Paramagnetospirillum magnetotacticum]KIL96844.1 HAD superfamily protein involved in N-acetyl-glucosamine catabolism [Paramagnetospirillum magnetotacticum MS-1]
MIAQISGLAAVAQRYDGFVLDLWGVIHDGVVAYPGVAETLAALRTAGKRTIMLSNAPRRASALIDQLTRLGIGRDLYDEVLSSGEAVHLELERRTDPVFAGLGPNLYHLGPERDRNVFDSLPYRSVDLKSADFVLNTGPVEVTESVADYQSVLDGALVRRLPMVCANPDHVVIRQGKRITCAGAIADRYADMGGLVVQRGKPDAAIYEVALAALGIADKTRVCAVGDALHTDIRGARAGGIDAVLVTGGIHADELGIKWGETADPVRLAELARHHGEMPVAALSKFIW